MQYNSPTEKICCFLHYQFNIKWILIELEMHVSCSIQHEMGKSMHSYTENTVYRIIPEVYVSEGHREIAVRKKEY